MPNVSPRDKCFATALETFQALSKEGGLDPGFKCHPQLAWSKDFSSLGTKWIPMKVPKSGFYPYLQNWLKKHMGVGDWQVRYPDVTVEYGDGSHQVFDTKWTQGDGRPESLSNKPGKYSRATQNQDFREINADQGHPTANHNLDKKSCGCEEKEKQRQLQPRAIPVPAPAPALNPQLFFLPMPMPMPMPMPAPMPLPAPMPMPFPAY